MPRNPKIREFFQSLTPEFESLEDVIQSLRKASNRGAEQVLHGWVSRCSSLDFLIQEGEMNQALMIIRTALESPRLMMPKPADPEMPSLESVLKALEEKIEGFKQENPQLITDQDFGRGGR